MIKPLPISFIYLLNDSFFQSPFCIIVCTYVDSGLNGADMYIYGLLL